MGLAEESSTGQSQASIEKADGVEAPKTEDSDKKDDGPPEKESRRETSSEKPTKTWELGWSEENFCAYRREILGPKQRGPTEFSAMPKFDDKADLDAPAICIFSDGLQHEVSHITMVSCRCLSSIKFSVIVVYKNERELEDIRIGLYYMKMSQCARLYKSMIT